MTKRESRVPTDLVKAAIEGGVAEADDLIRAVWPTAYHIALSVVRDRALAEDAAQEACAILFRAIGRLRSPDAFNVWFYRIVVREAAELDRRNFASPPEPLPDGRSEIDDAVMRVDVRIALAALSSQQRLAVTLYYYAEMNSREIAQILGIQDSSVRFHVMKARKALEKSLKEQSDTCATRRETSGAA